MTTSVLDRTSDDLTQDANRSSASPTRVLVVDDHQMFAEALAGVLNLDPRFAVVGTEATVDDAVRRLQVEPVDVVLLDLRLPDATRMSGLEDVTAAAPEAAIVLVTAIEDEAVLLAAVERGCAGVILKTAALDDVFSAVHRAAAGETLVSKARLTTLLSRASRRSDTVGPRLTPRETDVLTGIVQGASNAEIGRSLFLSVNTVRNHVQSLLGKLGAHSKLEAASIAVRDDLLGRAD